MLAGVSPIQLELDNCVNKMCKISYFNPNCGYILFLMYYI